jgi:NAD+ kinase
VRVHLTGDQCGELDGAVRAAGMTPCTPADAPEAIVCFGGDGTMIGAERTFPGVPKIPLRRAAWVADPPAALAHFTATLRRIAGGEHSETRLPKLSLVTSTGRRLIGLNDTLIHNAVVTSAVRFRVWIDGQEHFGEIVGDGVVIATPFGSSAYYRSITNSVIYVGIGLAFTNSTEPVNHVVLESESVVEIEITRGPALAAADNDPEVVPLESGDRVTIRLSDQQAVIWEIDNLVRMPNHEAASASRVRWMHPRANGKR